MMEKLMDDVTSHVFLLDASLKYDLFVFPL